MANKKEQESEVTALGRVAATRDVVKRRGGKKFHPSPAEKIRKLQRRGRGFEFLSAMMHLVQRRLQGFDPETPTEERLERAFDELGEDRAILESMVDRYLKLEPDDIDRVVSPRYRYRPVRMPLAEEELRATLIQALRPRTGLADCVRLCPCPGDVEPSTPVQEPHDFGLTFSHLYCVDESNPEWPGSDEPYVVFAGITEAMVESGTSAWDVRSRVYEDVDDGDRRPSPGEENLLVYGPVAPMAISSPFLVVATCMEHDDGSPSEVSSGLRASLTTVATTAAGVGGPAGWIVAGAAAIGVGVTFLYDLWADDDAIGEVQRIAMTEADAEALTSTVNPRILDPLHFDGGYDDGIYDVYMKLVRS